MSPDANDAINIPKSRPSSNTTPNGLYAARDFIREGEEGEYTDTLIALMAQLEPVSIVEEVFATEIMGATWRLRRCRLVEEAFGSIDDLDFDPMMDERTEKQQKSVDRARAQSHLILRRSLAELKKLQKGRASQSVPQQNNGDADEDMNMDDFEAMLGLSDAQLNQMMQEPGSFCEPTEPPPPPPPAAPAPKSSFCKPAPQTPRNAPCPCKSGAKYKRCCGKDAPATLTRMSHSHAVQTSRGVRASALPSSFRSTRCIAQAVNLTLRPSS